MSSLKKSTILMKIFIFIVMLSLVAVAIFSKFKPTDIRAAPLVGVKASLAGEAGLGGFLGLCWGEKDV